MAGRETFCEPETPSTSLRRCTPPGVDVSRPGPDDWCWYRTQPVVVTLNVAELIEDELLHPGLMGLSEALEAFDRRFDVMAHESDADAWDVGISRITDRYVDAYRLYAQRFAAAVTLYASQVPGLTTDAHVEADTDPNSHWWSGSAITNPHDTSDQLKHWRWCAAHDATPLPNIDIWIRTLTPAAQIKE